MNRTKNQNILGDIALDLLPLPMQQFFFHARPSEFYDVIRMSYIGSSIDFQSLSGDRYPE